jgi:DNA primase
MSDTVEQIKSRLDIVDIVSGYLKVQRAGINWKARCPFHNEKTPSFYISPERQSWHCFGCNKGGDMFSFVQDIEGVDFPEALRVLAAKAGVVVPEYRATDGQERSRRAALLAVTELSAKFFERQLHEGPAGAKALAYLRQRGMTDETIRVWRLGWAPNDWRALTGFLTSNGHDAVTVVAAGMAIEKNGRPYDRFRSRIMFPIADANGQVVGFTGRVFGAEVAVDGEPLAKYVNTPQTAIYDKGRILYGLDKAKLDMRKRDSALLVEGNVDTIMSWQAGATNVVATSGTALTADQLRMLARYSTNLDFCFDADQAGQVATRRGIGMALAQNFNVRILTLTDQSTKDPADFVAKYGAAWNDVVATAKPALQYYYDQAVAGFNPASAQHKKAVLASMGPLVRRLTSKVEQGHWVNQIASLLRAEAAAVQADLAAVRDDITVFERQARQEQEQTPAATTQPLDPLNLELLTIIAYRPALAAHAVAVAELADPRVAALLKEPALLTGDAGPYQTLVDSAFLRAENLLADTEDADLSQHIAILTARMQEQSIRTRRMQVELDLKSADATGDSGRVQELLAQFQDLTTELHRLQTVQQSSSSTIS